MPSLPVLLLWHPIVAVAWTVADRLFPKEKGVAA